MKNLNIFTKEGIAKVAEEAHKKIYEASLVKNMCAVDLGADYNKTPNGYRLNEKITFNIDRAINGPDCKYGRIETKIEKHLNITIDLLQKDLQMSFDDFSNEVINPMSYYISNKINQHIFKKVFESDCLSHIYSDPFCLPCEDILTPNGFDDYRKIYLIDRFLENIFLGSNFFDGGEVTGHNYPGGYKTSHVTEVISADIESMMPFCHGAVFDNKSIGFYMPTLDPAQGQPSSLVSKDGINIRALLNYDYKLKMTSLELDCLLGCFVIDTARIRILKEREISVVNVAELMAKNKGYL